MEQKSDYPRLRLLSPANLAKFEVASIEDALQLIAKDLFNSSGFKIGDGKAYGFHADQIEDEFVVFVEPVSLDGSRSQVLENIQHAMQKAFKRDINALCKE